MDLYLRSLGDGDLGEMVATDEGESLFRSEEPRIHPLRTVFGEHEITTYVYAPGPKQKIALAGVIFGLRQMAGKRRLKGQPRQEIEDVCRYFENNRERMRYDEYLKAGYPIATGGIEGACRHVVKDRMERSGMRWTLEGADATVCVPPRFFSGNRRTVR